MVPARWPGPPTPQGLPAHGRAGTVPLKMANRRKFVDYDWEAELAARQPWTTVASPPKRLWMRVREPVARLPRRARWALDVLGGVLGGAGFLDLVFHHSEARGTAFAMMVTGWALAFLLAPFKKTDSEAMAAEKALKRATRGTDLVQLFYVMGHEGAQFRVRPPHAGNYDEWLTSAREQIAQYSPSLAIEWDRPERTRGTLLDPPSQEAIRERLARIAEMHDRISKNGVPLEELAAAGFPGASEALATAGAA
jgi:hypothetical protein